MTVDWAHYVPEVTLRPQQLDALDRIYTAFFEDDKEVVILEAPTGVGKSIIQLALCRYFAEDRNGKSFMVTPQRALQDQMKTWEHLRIMKGKRSYECGLLHGATAATAPCNINPDIRKESLDTCSDETCAYFKALTEAQACSTVVHNYASLMSQAHIGSHFGQRSLLCLDEGHTAVHWIRSYLSSDIEPDDVASLTNEEPPDNPKLFLPWLRWVLSTVDQLPSGLTDNMSMTLMKMMSHKSAFGILTRDELEARRSASQNQRKSYESFAKHELMDSGLVPWATQWNEPDKWHKEGYWSTIPIRVAPMAGTLTGLGTKVLIVSATVLNKALISVELGLKSKEPELIVIDSAFPPETRPIRKKYAGSMSFRHRSKTMPKLLKSLVNIANRHHDTPGMVHTVSHNLAWDIALALREAMPDRVVELLPKGADRDLYISRFLTGAMGPSAILVGPSMLEGIDGAGDSCRWQALCKVPWPHMKDPIVEHLMSKTDSNSKRWAQAWYSWKAAQQTVQGVGRVCRSKDDFGTTYLLDSGFDRVLKSGYVPRYVLDAVT